MNNNSFLHQQQQQRYPQAPPVHHPSFVPQIPRYFPNPPYSNRFLSPLIPTTRPYFPAVHFQQPPSPLGFPPSLACPPPPPRPPPRPPPPPFPFNYRTPSKIERTEKRKEEENVATFQRESLGKRARRTLRREEQRRLGLPTDREGDSFGNTDVADGGRLVKPLKPLKPTKYHRRDALPEPNRQPRSTAWWVKPHLRPDMYPSLSPQEANARSFLMRYPRMGKKNDNKKKLDRHVCKSGPSRQARVQTRSPSARGHLNDDAVPTLFTNPGSISLLRPVATHSALFSEPRNEKQMAVSSRPEQYGIEMFEKELNSLSKAYRQGYPPAKRQRCSVEPPTPQPDNVLAKRTYTEKDEKAVVTETLSSSRNEKEDDSFEAAASRVEFTSMKKRKTSTGTVAANIFENRPQFSKPPTNPSKYKWTMTSHSVEYSPSICARMIADCFGNDRIMVYLASALCATDPDGFMKSREAVQIRERVLAGVYEERTKSKRAIGDDMGTSALFNAARKNGVLAPPDELVQIWKERAIRREIIRKEATVPCTSNQTDDLLATAMDVLKQSSLPCVVPENLTNSVSKENDQNDGSCGATDNGSTNEEVVSENNHEHIVPVDETRSAGQIDLNDPVNDASERNELSVSAVDETRSTVNLIGVEFHDNLVDDASERIEKTVGATDAIVHDQNLIFQFGDDDDDKWSMCFDDDQGGDEKCASGEEDGVEEEEGELKIYI